MTAIERAFTNHRGRLQGLAYRMLGSRADAEDILQDAYLRVREANEAEIRNVDAYLVTVVTRLCLDQLKSARARREHYVGPWLPEPVIDVDSLSPDTAVEIADDLSFALMLTLERLSAAERAAFLLHDVFDTPFEEVASALGKSEVACRQLASRARKAVRSGRPAHSAPPDAHRALLSGFVEAMTTGEPERLKVLLAADVIAYADGGGVKIAALNPIRGADNVARFFTGLARKFRAHGATAGFAPTTLNGVPGFIVHINGALDQTLSIDTDGDRITAIYVVRNPEKLQGIEQALQHGTAQPA